MIAYKLFTNLLLNAKGYLFKYRTMDRDFFKNKHTNIINHKNLPFLQHNVSNCHCMKNNEINVSTSYLTYNSTI